MEKIVEDILEGENVIEVKINLSPLRKKVKELNELGMMVTNEEMLSMLEKKIKGEKLDMSPFEPDTDSTNSYTWVIKKIKT